MSSSAELNIRRLELADFDFVRDLASKQPNFTIPPPYLLWLLRRIKGNVCLVAEQKEHGPVAYLLAVPVDDPPESLYVWQLASSERGRKTQAAFKLLTRLRHIIQQIHARALVFSALPHSPEYRANRRHLWKIFGTIPVVIGELPRIVAPHESEFQLQIRKQSTSVRNRNPHTQH